MMARMAMMANRAAVLKRQLVTFLTTISATTAAIKIKM